MTRPMTNPQKARTEQVLTKQARTQQAAAPILRRTTGDLVATASIAIVATLAVGGATLTANIREASLVQDNIAETDSVQILGSAPNALNEAFTVDNVPLPGQSRPLVSHGLIISTTEKSVRATNPDGSQAWEYSRKGDDVCSVGSAWDKVVVTFRTKAGCGDTVAIDAKTGQYADTRSSSNSDDVVPIASNDRVGTVSSSRIDLWRSDLVRTVEYGDVEAKQEAGMQPHEDCTINSALTRTDLLAVSETCPNEEVSSHLRFQKTTPEDSRKPEIEADVAIPSQGARLVAIGQSAATVYVPGAEPTLISLNKSGQEISRTRVAPASAINNASTPFAPATADLPHHMSWFDGDRLYLFTPSELKVEHVFDDAIGTGVAVGERLLMPVAQGIAVVDWTTGKAERIIPVDRGGYNGTVYLQMAGTNLVEARGAELVALRSA